MPRNPMHKIVAYQRLADTLFSPDDCNRSWCPDVVPDDRKRRQVMAPRKPGRQLENACASVSICNKKPFVVDEVKSMGALEIGGRNCGRTGQGYGCRPPARGDGNVK